MTMGLCSGCWLASSSRMIWRRLTAAFLSLQHVLEVELGRAHEGDQRPGRAARLEEHVVELEPRRLHGDVASTGVDCSAARLAGEIHVHARLADARGEPLREAAEPLLDDCEPLAQVVGARVELRVVHAGPIRRAR